MLEDLKCTTVQLRIYRSKFYFEKTFDINFLPFLLQLMYSPFDSGNFYVIPGSPAEVLRADIVLKNRNDVELRQKYGFNPDDFIIAVVGSHFLYSGIMLEHAVVLKALAPLLKQFRSKNETQSRLKVRILSSNLTDAYKMAIEVVILIFFRHASSCLCISC